MLNNDVFLIKLILYKNIINIRVKIKNIDLLIFLCSDLNFLKYFFLKSNKYFFEFFNI